MTTQQHSHTRGGSVMKKSQMQVYSDENMAQAQIDDNII